jgi:hypothetical protein
MAANACVEEGVRLHRESVQVHHCTLEDPVINEEGRRFLADLLVQLSDRQIRDLFEVARVELRARIPGEAASGSATIDEWVDAFNQKRAQIVGRHCM